MIKEKTNLFKEDTPTQKRNHLQQLKTDNVSSYDMENPNSTD